MKKLLIILSFACCIMAVQAQNVNLKKSVEDGIKTSIQQTENREWKEAFATCRALDGLIAVEEQKTKQAAPELHYLVSKDFEFVYLTYNQECRHLVDTHLTRNYHYYQSLILANQAHPQTE